MPPPLANPAPSRPVPQSGRRPMISRQGVRRLRLASGLTMFTYVFLHLLNHALGNISVAAMEAGLLAQKFIWQGVIGTTALYTAMATHFCLGLWAFYERRHYGWRRAEVVQLVLGLCIPLLLANHLYATRISLALLGTEKGYAQELYSFWVASPFLGAVQVSVLIVAWIHGCIGVNFWLRLKPVYPRLLPYLLCTAIILPMLALLGFFQGGRAILAMAGDPAWQAANLAPWQVGLPEQNAWLRHWRDISILACLGLFGLVLLARLARGWHERRGGALRVSYPNERSALVPRGFSVLEASRAAGIPHASVCGGRGRCSTCRVKVIGQDGCPPALPGEQSVLDRVGAGPGVRLACQLRPEADVSVVPLLRPASGLSALRNGQETRHGEERFVVALMVDMRNSSHLAETRMPFDAVFIIDRFIAAITQAVTAAGGQPTQFTGDGMMATFGLNGPAQDACRQALAAAGGIARNVAALNRLMETEMAEPVHFGIGLHGGTAVVGEIGFADSRVFTTLGEAANVAARLEELCKTFGCEVVASDDVCRLSGLDMSSFELRQTSVRGRREPLMVRTIRRGLDLGGLA